MKYSKNKLAVYEDGDPKKSAIIFIHGYPFDNTMWDNQINAFKDDYYCIRYDIRGLGQSEVHDGQYTMDMMVNDLFDIITEFNIVKPIICGLSMGGYIALRAMEINQNLFNAAILLDTRSNSDDNNAKIKRQLTIKKINEQGLPAFINEFIPPLFSAESHEKKKELIDNCLVKSATSSPIGVKGCQFAMMTRTDTTAFLSEIEIPVLVLCGADDVNCTPDYMQTMADEIKGSGFGIAPRAGHISPMENPGFINDMILGFLASINK